MFIRNRRRKNDHANECRTIGRKELENQKFNTVNNDMRSTEG